MEQQTTSMEEDDEDESTTTMISSSIDHRNYAPLKGNELYDKWKANHHNSLFPPDFYRLLDPTLDDEQRRGDLFQAEDEQAMNEYAWAIPDERALNICAAFAPLVEMGAGAGYWARLLRERWRNNGGDNDDVTVFAFDKNVQEENNNNNNNNAIMAAGVPIDKPFTKIHKGGPDVLPQFPNATLLLIYPDDHENESKDESQPPLSVASLQAYQGDTVIHVGEWLGSTRTLTMEGQGTPDEPYPWGRSTSPHFQIMLQASFHKILQVPLPNWGSVQNCLTVWKRTASVVLGGEDDGGGGDRYGYIPEDEQLEMTMASPSTRHLLLLNKKDDDDDDRKGHT